MIIRVRLDVGKNAQKDHPVEQRPYPKPVPVSVSVICLIPFLPRNPLSRYAGVRCLSTVAV